MAMIKTCNWCGRKYKFIGAGTHNAFCSNRCKTQGEANSRKRSSSNAIRKSTNISTTKSKSRPTKSNDDGRWFFALVGILVATALIILVAFAPGMVITSLFANSLKSSLGAWILSVIFSLGILLLIYFLFNKFSEVDKINKIKIGKIGKFSKLQIYSVVIYFVISLLSIWLIFDSNADKIVQICKLLKFWSE